MAGRHEDEMDAVWAQNTPGLSMEVDGCYVGLEAVRGYYVDFFPEAAQPADVWRLQPLRIAAGGPPGAGAVPDVQRDLQLLTYRPSTSGK